MGWHAYFLRRPPGWRDDYRSAVVAQALGGTFDSKKVFPALGMLNKQPAQDGPMASLKNSRFMQMMQSSVGGKKLKWGDNDVEDTNT